MASKDPEYSKRYRGTSLEEALAALKQDLGPTAVILGTRRIRRSRWLQWIGFSPLIVELLASPGTSRLAPSGDSAPVSPPDPEPARPLESVADQKEKRRIREEIDSLKGLTVDLMRHRKEHHLGRLPEGFYHWYRRIVELGIPTDRAAELITEFQRGWGGRRDPSKEELLGPLIDTLVRGIRFAPGVEPGVRGSRRFVFLGPPGMGKTTTVAKIASHLRLRHGADLALLSIDTRRVAAAEQLRAYAEMLGVPCSTVRNEEELSEKIREYSSREYLLVDTPGLSEGDADDSNWTASTLGRLEGSESFLVLSATTRLASMEPIFERFRPLGPRKLVITKIDESVTGWGLVESVRLFGGGLSYLSFGQNVPEDIVLATHESVGRVLRAVGGYDRDLS
ncbi:MAG: hypothetical protein QF752_08710 [Planctomycetota bacterium]|jgi:flagellar biosynthesis protein FlhF|nr:hypothetical protein [Planctomycetota bacterium]